MKYLKSLINLIFFITVYIGFTRPYVLVIEDYYLTIYPVDPFDFWLGSSTQVICMLILYRILCKFRKHLQIFKDEKKNIRSAAESLPNDQYDR
jgi:hypothetical protein